MERKSSPLVTPKKKKKKEFDCLCEWTDCKELRETIINNSPVDHPWSGDMMVLKHGETNKIKALLSSTLHHLPSKLIVDRLQKKLTITLARHHWPTSVLNTNRITTFMDSKTARAAVEESSCEAIMDTINKVHVMLELTAPAVGDMKCVRAPLMSRKDVFDHVSVSMSCRSNKRTDPVITHGTSRVSKELCASKVSVLIDAIPGVPIHIFNGHSSPAAAIEKNQKEVEEEDELSSADEFPVEHLKNIIKNKADLGKFNSNNFIKSVSVLHLLCQNIGPIKCNHGHVYLCQGIDGIKCGCTKYIFLKNFCSLPKLCFNCRINNRKSIRHDSAKAKNQSRTDETSHVNINSLSPASFHERMNSRKRHYRNLCKKQFRLQDKLDKKNMMTMDVNDGMRVVFAKIIDEINETKEDIKKALMSCIMKLCGVDENKKDSEQLSDDKIQEIANVGHKMNGKDKQVRFSGKTLRIALVLWLRSNKGHEELRDSGLMAMPSTRHL